MTNRSDEQTHQTWQNRRQYKGQINTEPSLTIPGQSLSMKELLERYVITGDAKTFRGVYTGEDESEIPDNFEKLSTIEKLDLAHNIRQDLANHAKNAARNAAETPPESPVPPTPEPPTTPPPSTE